MLETIPHRGPDDAAVLARGESGIGMTRLSIIDLEGGMQPFANANGNAHVVCNGEIYNFRALRRELEGLGYRFVSGSDAEVVIHAYDHYGLEFIHKLDGMFGLAIWDQARRRMVIARDRLGIKPLYYLHRPGRFAFGSEIKSIASTPAFDRELDLPAFLQYATYGHSVGERTIYRTVRKLLPGWRLRCGSR